MGKVVRSYKVDNLSKVNVINYKEGDIFITNRTVGILVDGKIKHFNTSKGLSKSDVQKMIDESLKKVGEINE